MPFFSNNGHRLHYRVTGKGEPLIFLHGMGFCGADWIAQERFFSKNYRVIIPDFRGYGKSEKPDHDYSVLSHTDDLNALMDHLGIDAAYMVGWSLGGMVALQFALDNPKRIIRLAVINAVPSKPMRYPWDALWQMQRHVYLDFLGMALYAQAAASFMFPFIDQIGLRNRVANKIASNSRIVYRRTIEAIFEWDLSHCLQDLKTPILFISGDRDFIPPATKRQIIQQMPNAHLKIVHNSGHGTPLDQPERTNALIGHFLHAVADG